MYIVQLPDKVCVSHMKPVGENKTVLQLKQFAEVLLTGLTFKKIFKKTLKNRWQWTFILFRFVKQVIGAYSHSFLNNLKLKY